MARRLPKYDGEHAQDLYDIHKYNLINDVKFNAQQQHRDKIFLRQYKIQQRRKQQKIKEQDEEDSPRSDNGKIKTNTMRRMLMSARNYSPNQYRKYVFTPESALSALPSLQINTIIPYETFPETLNKYK